MDRVMLTHPDTGAFFDCPAAAVDDWKTLGWEETDERPPEANPVVAERIAWEADQAQQTPDAPPAPEQPTTKRRSAATDPEGVNRG